MVDVFRGWFERGRPGGIRATGVAAAVTGGEVGGGRRRALAGVVILAALLKRRAACRSNLIDMPLVTTFNPRTASTRRSSQQRRSAFAAPNRSDSARRAG